MPASITVTFDGKQYQWNGKKWFDESTYLEPPTTIASKLHALSAVQIAAQDDIVTDLKKLLKRVKNPQKHRQIQRTLKVLRQYRDKSHKHVETVAILCGILRKANQPEEALALADEFLGTNYCPLLTARAAVLCDLNRWEEGLKQIRQVLAIEKGSGDTEATAVYSRIEQNAPELFIPPAPVSIPVPVLQMNMTAVIAMKPAYSYSNDRRRQPRM
jgi:tetratricopeptide (TPR) repeat protein